MMKRLQELARFSVIGGVATGIHYAILIALVQTGFASVVAASSVGFTISALANYALNRRLTFRSTRAHTEALPRFAAVALIGLGLNGGLVWLFHVTAGLHYIAAQMLATCGTLLWNYSANRLWTFPMGTSPREVS